MIERQRLISLAFHRRGIVWLVFLFASIYGFYCWKQLPIEAYPDISDTSAQIITQVPGLAAEEVEQQITIPLEREINGTPGIYVMRSNSTFGLSLITLVFQDGTENYWARQRLQERISGVELPYGAQPGLDPLTSPVGEIFRYTLESPTRDLRELSELQFWKVIPRIKQVPGVVDVSNFGGLTTQFILELDPANLTKYHVSLSQITQTINANNANAGGSILDRGQQGFVVRGVGLITGLEDLGNIVVTQKDGVPVLVKNLGEVKLGYPQRKGILGKDEKADTIQGITLMLKGENPSRVLEGVHEAVRDLNENILPKDVKLVPYLDRTDLVDKTVHTVEKTLFEGLILVSLLLLLFLGSLRGALIVAVTIPVSLLVAFTCMHHFNIPANLLSLGAIDFGILVDGAIIVLENILRRREEEESLELSEKDVMSTAMQVTRPVFFGMLVVISAYLPLFAFQRIEYKLFSPMAFAVGFSIFGALAVALLLVPGLAYHAYHRPRKVFHNPVFKILTPLYDVFLQFIVGQSWLAVVALVVTLGATAFLGGTIGRDYLPYLDEGSIWLQVTLPPGISLDKATEMSNELRRVTREFKETSFIVTQLGRTDDGMDPWTPSHIEAMVGLHPYESWASHLTKLQLIEKMSKRFSELSGFEVGFAQPISDMVLDKVAGAHSDLVVKVYGSDFRESRRIAGEVVAVIKAIPGAEDVMIDQQPPLPQVRIRVDRNALARVGINVSDVADLIETGIGGKSIAQIFIEERSYDIAVRFSKETRDTPQAIGNLVLTTPTGAQIPLSQVAEIGLDDGESTITREMGKRHLTVRINVRNRDLSSFLNDAKEKLQSSVQYDHSQFHLAWGGQFENQQRAQARLMLILPMVLALMFLLLFAEFGNIRLPVLVLLTVPMAGLGGLAALQFREMTLNVSSAVGFIAVFGVTVLNAIIMVSNMNRWRLTPDMPLKEAVRCGAGERLRSVLVTGTVATAGMIPAVLAHGLGSDVQRPLATVVVGGLVSGTFLTLALIPPLYYLIQRRFGSAIGKAKPQVDSALPTSQSQGELV
ncbi:MAG: CusA/CzcA family heavy metal efflux RND transporter [Candidatus Ozemobacteraceae bacterium]